MKGFLISAAIAAAACTPAQLRVATYNLSNYGGGRQADLQNILFAEYQGRSLRPDVIVLQEFTSQSAANAFLNILNSSPGSSGTWVAAPFTDGPDTDNAMFYRSDRINLVASTTISQGGATPNPPRDTRRYDISLKGFAIPPKVAIYSSHMKAGTSSDDQARRLVEASRIRQNAAALGPTFQGFVVAGDFNVQSAADDGYDKLVGSETNNTGRVFDPIATPGSWDNNGSFRFVHTQDPSNFGMDSRFDFVLLSDSLRNGFGFDYMGNPNQSYSTTTWDDGSHSYRVWGNDGSSFNQTLRITGNTMVGPTIAQSLVNAATTAGGHLPVFLDLTVPAEASASPTQLNFGTVIQGNSASTQLSVANTVNTVLWRMGIAPYDYTLASTNFTVPSGTFRSLAGNSPTQHLISANTQSAGTQNGTVTITPTHGEANTIIVPATITVVPNAFAPSGASVRFGTLESGNNASLAASDDDKWIQKNAVITFGNIYSTEMEFTGNAPIDSVSQLSVQFETSTQLPSMYQRLQLFDWQSNQYVTLIDSPNSTQIDTQFTIATSNPNRFIKTGTREMKGRLAFQRSTPSPFRSWICRIDQIQWRIQ